MTRRHLRQAQMGIAVFTATDVAKSAAGIVLTEPGLGGIVAAVEEGRVTFQRILTYTFRSIVHKVVQVLFLLAGLVISGSAVLTPLLMVMMMVAGDFFALSSSTDNVRRFAGAQCLADRQSHDRRRHPGVLRSRLLYRRVSRSVVLFSNSMPMTLRTLTVITLVYSGQAIFYVSRERHHLWSSRPGWWLIASSIVDITLFGTFDPGHPYGAIAGNYRSMRIRRGNRAGLLPGHVEGYAF